MGPEMQHGTKSAILAKDMGPKVQQKKLQDQIETLAKVMGPKMHFGLKLIFCDFNMTNNIK